MRAWWKALAWLTALVSAVLLVLYAFFFDVWRVPTDDPLLSASIQPALMAGDIVVVTRHATVARGDLLRCADPQAPGRFVIARATAQGGEHVSIEDDVVNVDGTHLPSPRACDEKTRAVFNPNTNDDVELVCGVQDFGEVTFGALRAEGRPSPPTRAQVDSGKWFLVSDDRYVHLDSRDFGQLDPASCQHIVFRIVSAKGYGDAKARFTLVW